MAETAIKIENLKKRYRLGAIGGQTLNAELQSWWARKRGKEDPNLKLGETYDNAGETFFALNGINLEIKQGEAVGIIGRNGAGKSTLLKILSRVTAPTEGDVWINGRISSMLEVGTGFHGEMTGRENIYMNGAILGMTKKEVDDKIESIIDFSECRQFIDTPVKRYSSGMYVKLAFAVASHLDSEIMIMDEVLAVGDMKFQKKCLGKMGDEAKGGKTVLYVSHNMATIRNLCTRCIVLDKGRVIYDGDVEKAIDIYSEALENSELIICKSFRESPRISSMGTLCKINYFEFLDVRTPQFEAGDVMVIRLEVECMKSLNNIIARMAIRTSGDECIGISETDVASELSGKSYVVLKFNTKNLPESKYSLTVSLNRINDAGGYEMLDGTPEKIAFCILEDKIFGTHKSRWDSKYFGKVRLDPMEMEIKNIENE